MTDTATIAGGPALQPNSLNLLVNDVTVLPGMPVIPSVAGKIALGQANTAATCRVIGMATTPGGDGDHVRVTYVGPVQLSAAEWDAIAGTSGGLAALTPYYLSAATAGHITSTKPTSTNLVVPIEFSAWARRRSC